MHDLAAPYALNALDELERRRYERHLTECARCRDALGWLQEAATSLAFAPPPVAAAPPLRRSRTRRRLALHVVPALAAAAAALLLAVHLHESTAPQTLALAGAAGRLVVQRDRSARLEVALPNAAPGTHYEAWVVHEGRMRAAGSFAAGGTVPLTVPVPRGDRVAVTVEPGRRVIVEAGPA